MHLPELRSSPTLVAALTAAALLPPAADAQCELARLGASDGQPGAGFGRALAIEGGRALVGAPNLAAGSAYVFELSPIFGWSQRAILTASDGALGDAFGGSVDLSGARLAVGAPGNAHAGFLSGAVYVFAETPGGWSEVARLTAADAAEKDFFGGSNDAGQGLALDGTTLLVGAAYADGSAPDTGAAYVFEGPGGSWTQAAKLTASSEAAGASFGAAVALDGDTALIGAPWLPGAPDTGRVHAFERGGSGWTETALLEAADLAAGNRFGAALALDGTWAAVGAPRSGAAGAVHVFARDPSGWTEVQRLEPLPGDPAEAFGTSVALSGQRLLVGAAPPNVAKPSAPPSAAIVYEHDGTSWVRTAVLANPAAPGYAGIAGAVALADDVPLVGSRQIQGLNADPGAASVFALQDDGCPGPATLTAGPEELSLADGGAQGFLLNAGTYHAGDTYLLLGSASGTSPGFALDAGVVPLNPDAYLGQSILAANQGPFQSTLGVLDGNGFAAGELALAPGQDPALAGTTLHHAYVLFRSDGQLSIGVATSNAVAVTLGTPAVLLAEDFEGGAPGWTFSNPLFGLWHVAADGECGATSRMAAYDRGPAACDYDDGVGGLNAGTLISPAFLFGGQPPHRVSFRSACELDGNGDDLVSVVLENLDGPETLALALAVDLESGGLTEWRNLVVPSSGDWVGRNVRLRFTFGAMGAGGNDTLGWLVDDVLVTASAP